MDSAINKPGVDDAPESVCAAWQHFKDMLSASSRTEAWQSCRKAIETLPGWAYVVVIVCAIALVSNGSFLLVLLAIGGFFVASYLTVRHAVLSALREYDARRRT